MMDEKGFNDLVREIQRLGYDEETAARYAMLIGDMPVVDEEGKTVVLDEEGKELARLKLRAG